MLIALITNPLSRAEAMSFANQFARHFTCFLYKEKNKYSVVRPVDEAPNQGVSVKKVPDRKLERYHESTRTQR